MTHSLTMLRRRKMDLLNLITISGSITKVPGRTRLEELLILCARIDYNP